MLGAACSFPLQPCCWEREKTHTLTPHVDLSGRCTSVEASHLGVTAIGALAKAGCLDDGIGGTQAAAMPCIYFRTSSLEVP